MAYRFAILHRRNSYPPQHLRGATPKLIFSKIGRLNQHKEFTGITKNNAHKTGYNRPLSLHYAHMREKNAHMRENNAHIPK